MTCTKISALTTALLIITACSQGPVGNATAEEPAFDATAAFTALARAEVTDGAAWFELAGKARTAGDLDTAAKALEKAAEQNWSPARILIETARLRVAQDDSEGAVAALNALLDSGFTAVRIITGDPELASLAGQAGYDELVRKMTVQAYPCSAQEQFSEFDFWVGEWDVHVASGQLAGHNRIESAQKGCVLIENWTSTTGGKGMSINYVDKTTNEWVQIWHSESGSQINIRGGLTDEGMLLVGNIHYVANGTTAPFRGTWTLLPDGRVRQFFEQSNDDGETWVSWFEAFYTRVDQREQAKRGLIE